MWRVGLLYRVPHLIRLLDDHVLGREQWLSLFPRFQGVDTDRLIDLVLCVGWAEVSLGKIVSTPEGRTLLTHEDPAKCLREELRTLVRELAPPWIALARHGRAVIARYLADEPRQCFSEAGLLSDVGHDVIQWWDSLLVELGAHRDLKNLEIGREGELKSLRYEAARTGHEPTWIALDYSDAGYDVLSRLNADDGTRLPIEVKASRSDWSSAVFHLTRNEWQVLSRHPYAVLHLWSLGSVSKLGIVPIDLIAEHIPKDCGRGQWENAAIPFSCFGVTDVLAHPRRPIAGTRSARSFRYTT
jgi:hypothetical protein